MAVDAGEVTVAGQPESCAMRCEDVSGASTRKVRSAAHSLLTHARLEH